MTLPPGAVSKALDHHDLKLLFGGLRILVPSLERCFYFAAMSFPMYTSRIPASRA